jgi:hypothetical protein
VGSLGLGMVWTAIRLRMESGSDKCLEGVSIPRSATVLSLLESEGLGIVGPVGAAGGAAGGIMAWS